MNNQTAVLTHAGKKDILLDYEYDTANVTLPVVIFCHGLKGFKDWGAWNLMGSAFAKAEFLFIKFNFSHNGGTTDQPIDFPDLEAFGNNNYSIELDDLQRVLAWLENSGLTYDPQRIHLVGHSRAGGITTITAANDKRVNKLITLAGVADYGERFPKGPDLDQWKEKGVYRVKNSRTGQEMPFYYQMYEDYQENAGKLDIIRAAKRLEIPHLIVHGTDDPTVSINDAYRMHDASPLGKLAIIRGADHVFGASHPWESSIMPHQLQQAVQCMVNFLNED